MNKFTSLLLLLCLTTALSAKTTLVVIDADTKKLVPCRIHLRNSNGKVVKVSTYPFWRDHFVIPGRAELMLPNGIYRYEIERGPEYQPSVGRFKVENQSAKVEVNLKRLVDLKKEGWWSGDLHIHRLHTEVPLLMRAEDLHFGPVITWWNNRNQWARAKRLPEKRLIRFDENRFYHLMAGEDERGGGALLYFNLNRPLPISGAKREYPSSIKFLKSAQKLKAHVDIEKPFWWDVPLWLAHGEIDTIGLANNHMCRSQMYESEAWGKPRDAKRLPPPRGNGFWTQEIYYHILNSGIRIAPSAGSASGALPNPVGYNRVYVYLQGKPTWEKWWRGLRSGRSFVTNGPLLRVTINGQKPGAVLKSDGKRIELEVQARLTSKDAMGPVEVIHNGRVIKSIPWKKAVAGKQLCQLSVGTSGWILVRAIALNRKTFRFGSTAPFYLEVGKQKRVVDQKSVKFFLKWIDDRAAQLRQKLKGEELKSVMRYVEESREYWKKKVRDQ